MKQWFKAIVWPWQYKRKVAQYEARIAELKLAGWTACCGWGKTIGYINSDQWNELCREYSWHRENAVFALDKPIDGKRPINPDFSEYKEAGVAK